MRDVHHVPQRAFSSCARDSILTETEREQIRDCLQLEKDRSCSVFLCVCLFVCLMMLVIEPRVSHQASTSELHSQA